MKKIYLVALLFSVALASKAQKINLIEYVNPPDSVMRDSIITIYEIQNSFGEKEALYSLYVFENDNSDCLFLFNNDFELVSKLWGFQSKKKLFLTRSEEYYNGDTMTSTYEKGKTLWAKPVKLGKKVFAFKERYSDGSLNSVELTPRNGENFKYQGKSFATVEYDFKNKSKMRIPDSDEFHHIQMIGKMTYAKGLGLVYMESINMTDSFHFTQKIKSRISYAEFLEMKEKK